MGMLANALAVGPSSEKSQSIYDVLRDSISNISGSGKSVTVTNAIKVSTVFAVCRVIGEGLAQVPCNLMRKEEKNRLPAKDHPLYEVLNLKPNSWQTSFEYREMMAWHLVLTGSHFSYINRVKGKIRELIPFEPGQVTVKRAKDYSLSYVVTAPDGSTATFQQEDIWHVRGPSWNGWQGLKAVSLAREAIGLAMATEEAASTLHVNGVNTSGVYSVEGKLTDSQHTSLSKWIKEHNAGSGNNGNPLIMDRAAKWLSTQMSGVDAQSLETRKFQIEEICRFARVMPIMVGYSDKAATYASAEQMFLAHVVHTLAPWYQRIEQSMSVNLLTAVERESGYYTNFDESGLLRGSAKDTKDTILGYVHGGLITQNEGREKLNLNPFDDPKYDIPMEPVNITGGTEKKEEETK